jgi:hypothetical protein
MRTADPLGCAPPDFLLRLVALANCMRLSLRERRTRNRVQRSVAGNPGRDDKKERTVAKKGRLLDERAQCACTEPYWPIVRSSLRDFALQRLLQLGGWIAMHLAPISVCKPAFDSVARKSCDTCTTSIDLRLLA